MEALIRTIGSTIIMTGMMISILCLYAVDDKTKKAGKRLTIAAIIGDVISIIIRIATKSAKYMNIVIVSINIIIIIIGVIILVKYKKKHTLK